MKKVRCENYKKCRRESCGHYWDHKYTSACLIPCFKDGEWKYFKCINQEEKEND